MHKVALGFFCGFALNGILAALARGDLTMKTAGEVALASAIASTAVALVVLALLTIKKRFKRDKALRTENGE